MPETLDTSGNKKTIVHMDLDSFFVSVECLLNPSLKGKPVIVGGTGDRGVVSSCSYEARKFGVHSAMPMAQAIRLCPKGIVIRGSYEEYSKHSRIVTQIIEDNAPLYEKTSIDEFYLDISGLDRFFGCWKWAQELRQKIMKETGLPISMGVSSNKTISKIATGEAKPNGELLVPHGKEKEFLAPMPVSKIPMVGEKTYETLIRLGVSTIASVQQMTLEQMEKIMGEHGASIWYKANGLDNRIIEPNWERKSISTENTFQKDVEDVAKLKAMLVGMTEQLTYQLRDEGKVTGCVAIKLRYPGFETHTTQTTISYTASDHLIIPRVKALFDKLHRPGTPVRLIGVRFSHLVDGNYQADLFNESDEMNKLYEAMDKLRNKFGDDKVMRAINTLTENERVEKEKRRQQGKGPQDAHLYKKGE
jgi:DNA polymerase-4